MNGVIGLNILGDRAFNSAVLISYIQQLQPAYCVCLNNPSLAAQLIPFTRVIARFTPDDNAQDRGSGADFVKSRRASVPKGAYLYCGNEPSATKRLNNFTLEAQAEAGSDLKLAILNLATGHPEPTDWDVLAPCVENAVKRDDLICVHEYWTGDPLKSPSFPYHIGRCFDAVKRFGGQWVVTESGYSDGFNPYRGWQVAISAQQYEGDYRVLAESYADHRMGLCIFSWPDWDAHGFGIDGSQSLQVELAELNKTFQIGIPVTQPSIQVPPILGDSISATINASLGLRQHTAPSVNAPTLRTLPFQAAVVEYPSTIVQESTHPFVYVVDSAGNNGWVSSVYLTPVEADTPIVSLSVPYVAQVSGTANHYRNDCGCAAALMCIRWRYNSVRLLVPTFTVDELAAKTTLPLHDNGLTSEQLATLLEGYGVWAQVNKALDVAAIRRNLDLGMPVICLLNYADFNPANAFKGGHFAVAIAYGANGVYFNDPYAGGAKFYVSNDALEQALKDVSAFASTTNQGVTFVT